jgi:hypothetical protein
VKLQTRSSLAQLVHAALPGLPVHLTLRKRQVRQHSIRLDAVRRRLMEGEREPASWGTGDAWSSESMAVDEESMYGGGCRRHLEERRGRGSGVYRRHPGRGVTDAARVVDR